jgi:hypothetical protein
MSNITRQQWDDICEARISALMFNGRVKAEVAIRHANETMVQDYGPRPDPEPEKPKAPEPPWWARAAIRVTLGKEQKGMAQRVLVSLVYAISAMVAAFQAGGMPSTPEQWAALVMAGVIAFWGKFSSNTTIVAANRAAWTPEERKQDALDQLNKGL